MARVAAVTLLASAALVLGYNPPSVGKTAEASGPPTGLDMSPSFSEEFNGAAVNPKVWNLSYGPRSSRSRPIGDRSLPSNAELQIYADKNYLKLGIDPFKVSDGKLEIKAEPLSSRALDAILMELNQSPNQGGRDQLKNIRYSSGAITTRDVFQQQYGYFEIRARWSAGKGIWPAFWLLPATGAWPPEIDVIEAHGDKPNLAFLTIHSGVAPRNGQAVSYEGAAQDFHNFGALWMPDRVDYYIDGKKVASIPAAADTKQPMYMLVNLAIGGNWPGNPTPDVKFPATMDVDYVRAWKFNKLPTSIPAR